MDLNSWPQPTAANKSFDIYKPVKVMPKRFLKICVPSFSEGKRNSGIEMGVGRGLGCQVLAKNKINYVAVVNGAVNSRTCDRVPIPITKVLHPFDQPSALQKRRVGLEIRKWKGGRQLTRFNFGLGQMGPHFNGIKRNGIDR